MTGSKHYDTQKDESRKKAELSIQFNPELLQQYLKRVTDSYKTFWFRYYKRNRCKRFVYRKNRKDLEALERKLKCVFEHIKGNKKENLGFRYQDLRRELELTLKQFLSFSIEYFRMDLSYPDFDLLDFLTRSFHLDYIQAALNNLDEFFRMES